MFIILGNFPTLYVEYEGKCKIACGYWFWFILKWQDLFKYLKSYFNFLCTYLLWKVFSKLVPTLFFTIALELSKARPLLQFFKWRNCITSGDNALSEVLPPVIGCWHPNLGLQKLYSVSAPIVRLTRLFCIIIPFSVMLVFIYFASVPTSTPDLSLLCPSLNNWQWGILRWGGTQWKLWVMGTWILFGTWITPTSISE